MINSKIGFIGAGNMASSLIGGLCQQGIAPEQIWASDLNNERINYLKQTYGIHIDNDNQTLAKQCDILVFAIKPHVCQVVASSLRSHIDKQLILSVAAGITTGQYNEWLGEDVAVVRCMPNTPALLGFGASGLFANAHTSAEQRSLANQILASVGITQWFNDESQLDAVTAVSGSGPAYFFLLMEILEQTAIELGLNDKAAQALVKQTALGAAHMVQTPDADFAQLRQAVTSPNGTTEAALTHLENDHIRRIISSAVKAAYQRATILSKEA